MTLKKKERTMMDPSLLQLDSSSQQSCLLRTHLLTPNLRPVEAHTLVHEYKKNPTRFKVSLPNAHMWSKNNTRLLLRHNTMAQHGKQTRENNGQGNSWRKVIKESLQISLLLKLKMKLYDTNKGKTKCCKLIDFAHWEGVSCNLKYATLIAIVYNTSLLRSGVASLLVFM